MKPILMIDGYRLNLTCHACPEQYDVLDPNDTTVAYMRLRHGKFTVECPDVGGTLVYSASPKGDGLFYDDERIHFLRHGMEKVTEWIANEQFKDVKDEYEI